MQNFMLERLLERISVLAYNLETVMAEKLETNEYGEKVLADN